MIRWQRFASMSKISFRDPHPKVMNGDGYDPPSLPPSFFIHYHSIIVLYIGIFSLLILVKCCRETIQIINVPVSFQRQDSFNNSAFGQMLHISQTSVRCVENERSCFLFSTSLLPPRTLSSPPPALRRMLLVGAANGQTHPSH